MGLFNDRTQRDGKTGVPVWFMRQAGRYHSHYQGIKKKADFRSMGKTPDLAMEVTMGPTRDFDFDAAILFSDLLFPLEHLGMGLKYEPGPILDMRIETKDDLNKLKVVAPLPLTAGVTPSAHVKEPDRERPIQNFPLVTSTAIHQISPSCVTLVPVKLFVSVDVPLL